MTHIIRRATLALCAASLTLFTGAASAVAHSRSSDPATAVVSTESGQPYGQVLVVGGGGAGFVPGSTTPIWPADSSLYMASIDPPALPFEGDYHAGCGTTLVAGPFAGGIPGPLSCTGLETDQSADWQALTTDRWPIAGPGVNPFLLGDVYRADLGTFQVTYAGHPLYLFVPGADNFFGANIVESVLPLPPWQTVWYLLSPGGLPATGPATLETMASKTGPLLANSMLPGLGGIPVAVYTFSLDHGGHSHCYGACARDFVPVLTVGTPTAGSTGVNGAEIGTTRRFDGTEQVTYNGHPLYMYSQEQFLPDLSGTAGNGDGVSAYGGTFNALSP